MQPHRIAAALAVCTLAIGCASSHTGAMCVADLGCPAAREPRPCGELSDSIDVETAWANREQLLAQEVALRGFLAIHGDVCTLLACSDRACCNRCDGRLVLSSLPQERLSHPLPSHIFLTGSGEWGCTGDETGQCCAYVPTLPVVVYGTLETEPSTNAELAVRVTAICRQ